MARYARYEIHAQAAMPDGTLSATSYTVKHDFLGSAMAALPAIMAHGLTFAFASGDVTHPIFRAYLFDNETCQVVESFGWDYPPRVYCA